MPTLQHRLHSTHTGQTLRGGHSGQLRIFKLQLAGSDLDSSSSAVSDAAGQSALLNSGHRIPWIGLGTWKSDKGQVSLAVSAALKAGYRHLDCAAVYENEHEVGEALQQAFECNVVQRSEVFVTSKLW